MFTSLKISGIAIELYSHTTDGGAEYLMDAHKGSEGVFDGASVIIRVDGHTLEFVKLDI
jgi:hypothetical protein